MGNITLNRRDNLATLLQQFVQQRVAQGAAPKGLEQEFAAQLQVSPSMLSQVKSSRPIGDKLARQVETLCGLPAGWLDEERALEEPPDGAQQRFLDAAGELWRASNGREKRELMRWLADRRARIPG